MKVQILVGRIGINNSMATFAWLYHIKRKLYQLRFYFYENFHVVRENIHTHISCEFELFFEELSIFIEQ